VRISPIVISQIARGLDGVLDLWHSAVMRVTTKHEYFVGPLSSEENDRLFDAVFDATDCIVDVDANGIVTTDDERVVACIREVLGRDIEDIVYVDELVSFEWYRELSDRMAAAFETLPGWIGLHHGAQWFGIENRDAIYLCGSMEPPGLQVVGRLRRSQWDAWSAAFDALVRSSSA
jgi:hypothetical protein